MVIAAIILLVTAFLFIFGSLVWRTVADDTYLTDILILAGFIQLMLALVLSAIGVIQKLL